MKKTLQILFILQFGFCNLHFAFSQNLVPNYSFEEYDSCPVSTNQVYRATGWNIDINSSDYYNSCATYNSMVDIPNSGAGYQCPANGNAYCGFTAYREIQDQYREYFGRDLSNSLIIGQKYFISFKLSLVNDVSSCAVNKIGIKFTNVNYGDTTLLPVPVPVMNNMASFYTDMIISDTLGWTTITGTYIADSSYQYILIGNFFDNSNTDTSIIYGTIDWCNSYYFIDDLCVSIDSLTCVIPNGSNVCDSGVYIFEKNLIKEIITIYPNPANDKIFIEFPTWQTSSVKIYNIFQQVLYEKIYSDKIVSIDLSLYSAGLYVIQIQQENQIINKKFIVTQF